MPIKVQIEDPRSSFSNFIDDEGALSVSERFSPPFGVVDFIQPLVLDMTDDGLATGNADMRVDGSVTPQQFFIKADTTRVKPADRYINSVVFTIADQSSELRHFGALTRLTNGCRLFYISERGEVTIRSGLKSNFDFVRLCVGEPAWGTSLDSFQADRAIGTGGNSSDAFFPVLNFSKVFGTQFGIKLSAGSTQKLIIEINDDVTTVDEFTALGLGFDRLDTRSKLTAKQSDR